MNLKKLRNPLKHPLNLPRWVHLPEKGSMLVAAGLLLVFSGLPRVIAMAKGGANSLNAANIASSGEAHLVATKSPTGDEVYPYLAKATATPFQPGEASPLQEFLNPEKPRPTPLPVYIPDSISIPAIGLQAGIVPVGAEIVELNGAQYEQWQAPDEFAVGWHDGSATLGLPGNTVLNGHNNIYGEVFRDLEQVKQGDKIYLTSGEKVFTYQVTNSMKLVERYQDTEKRLENARWIEKTTDERLTLVTCWPYTNNTYRWVIVAVPVGNPVDRALLN